MPQPERRQRRYQLRWADGAAEVVAGVDPATAMATRTRPERPVQIMDLTGVEEWMAARLRAQEAATATRL